MQVMLRIRKFKNLFVIRVKAFKIIKKSENSIQIVKKQSNKFLDIFKYWGNILVSESIKSAFRSNLNLYTNSVQMSSDNLCNIQTPCPDKIPKPSVFHLNMSTESPRGSFRQGGNTVSIKITFFKFLGKSVNFFPFIEINRNWRRYFFFFRCFYHQGAVWTGLSKCKQLVRSTTRISLKELDWIHAPLIHLWFTFKKRNDSD